MTKFKKTGTLLSLAFLTACNVNEEPNINNTYVYEAQSLSINFKEFTNIDDTVTILNGRNSNIIILTGDFDPKEIEKSMAGQNAPKLRYVVENSKNIKADLPLLNMEIKF